MTALSVCTAGVPCSFTINSRDDLGATVNVGGAAFVVTVDGSNAVIVDNNDGTYAVSFLPKGSGSKAIGVAMQTSGGLRGSYYENIWFFYTPVMTRVDAEIAFDWGEGLLTSAAGDYVSVRWEGSIMASTSEEHTLCVILATPRMRAHRHSTPCTRRAKPCSMCRLHVPPARTELRRESDWNPRCAICDLFRVCVPFWAWICALCWPCRLTSFICRSIVSSDDGARLFVDGVPLIDCWDVQCNRTEATMCVSNGCTLSACTCVSYCLKPRCSFKQHTALQLLTEPRPRLPGARTHPTQRDAEPATVPNTAALHGAHGLRLRCAAMALGVDDRRRRPGLVPLLRHAHWR